MMKKYIFSLFFLTLLFSACDENMPEIACLSCGEETTINLEPQDKRVMVEEFTGVRCIGCPAGSTELQNLINQSGGRLIAVSIHAGFFAKPYDENQYDFRTDGGNGILDYLGRPEANPAAVVDRRKFDGEADLQLVNTSSWAGRIAQQYEETAKVSLALENTYNANNGSLSIKVIGEAQELISEEVRLTIMIAESGIMDNQLTPESSPDSDPNYIHNHVLRDVLTASDGDVLSASMTAGQQFEETYNFSIPTEWEVSNCNVIAFVHLFESSQEILQATEEHLAD